MSVNNSSTGGPLYPNPQPPTLVTTPPGLTLTQFLQRTIAGISGFPGPLVRPNWQPQPPNEPDLPVNWIAFGIMNMTPDANAYVGFDQNENPFLQRNELLEIDISVYGPLSYDNMALIRDGFQLTQNLAQLKAANMGFAYDQAAMHVPDLVNGRWIDRWRSSIFLRRQIQREYPILNFVSVSGTTYIDDPDKSFTWSAS